MPTSKTVNLKLWRQNFERVAAVQGEDKARVLSMVISEREGVPFDMSGYTAEIYMHEANGRDVTLPAEIDGNIVTAVVPLITAAGDAAIQVILTKSTGEILKVAGLVLDVQPSELENAVDGSDEFNLLVGVTKQTEKAAGDALEAADIALEAADSVKARADSGEFNGDKGDTGPQGPQGVSGVYVGGGDMPEGYTVQVDPTGDMLCYTAGESDSRYANVLTGTASGPVAALEDVSPTGALRRAAVLGATAETGEGDKGPDNPYTLAGVQPTKVTVCGKNLLPVTRSTPVTQGGITLTPLENGLLKLSGTCTANNNCPVFCTQPVRLDGTLTATVQVQSGTAEFVGYNLVQYNGDIGGLTLVNMKTKEHHFQRTCMASGFNIRMDAGTVFNDYVFGIQLEKGDTATPYEPYTGQTITLPALEPLYGDGTVNDEYDAVSGVETRRWKRVVFDGTESMRCEAHGNGQRYVSIDLDAAANKSVMPISTHYTSSAWTQDNNKVYIPNPVVMVITDSRFTTLQAARDILAAQYAAGTPVTVVYQLAEPVITQHDPARILPPAPVCRVFADAGNTAVGYNRDVNIVIPKLEAALAELLGGGAQPME